ncbi:MAG: hypothetical protein NTY02_18880 [Acidobacteria bacterium]|nr:hypothetical protein [Acidobacteriota bacterium]
MVVEIQPGADALQALIGDHEFRPYRNYRVLSRKRQDAVMRAEIQKALGSAGAQALTVRHDWHMAAAVVFQPLEWDTAFFGVPMARLSHLLRAPDAARDVLEVAIDASLAHARDLGIAHVTARADVADAEGVAALESRGFLLMDALMTYIYHPKRDLPPPVKEMGLLRPYRAEDLPQILDITREAFHGFRGRFHLDPHLPDDRCDELYIEWARGACAFRIADVVLVTENERGEIHGWTSYRKIEPVSTVGGMPIFGAGLGACRRSKPGAYAGLIRGGAALVHGQGGVAECQTQNYNFSTIRVYEALGFQYVRADYTFHAWLR